MKRMIISFVIGCVIGSGALLCAGGKTEPAGAAEAAKELVLRQAGGNFGYPNPFRHQNRGPGFFKMELLYDSLLEKDEKGLIPWLAKEWTISEDGKSFTFTLVDGAVWHDGYPLTAEDVAFSAEYFKKHPPVRGGLMLNGKYIIESVSTDKNTVTIRIPVYTPTALEKIGSMRIIPKHIWEKIEDPVQFAGEGAAVGSGPYMLVEYNPEHGAYKMKKFERFWGFKPAAAVLEWIPVSDTVLAFQNKEIDIVQVSADLLGSFEKNTEYKVVKNFGLHNFRLYFNFDKVQAFRDKTVRQAIAYAIDRQELIAKLERGSGLEGSQGYLPPMHALYNPNLPAYAFNKEKAQALMRGKNFAFTLTVGNSAKEIKMAELIKIRLADIGITVQVVSADSKARDGMVKNKEYEAVLINSGGMGADADMLRELYSSQTKQPHLAGYTNRELDDLLYRQSIEKDPVKRKNLVYRIQEILAEEIPLLLLYGQVDNTVYRPKKYDGWTIRYDHTKLDHPKLSYVIRP